MNIKVDEIHSVQIITELTYENNKYIIDDMDGEVLVFVRDNPKDEIKFSDNLDTLVISLDDSNWIDISHKEIGQELTEWYEENKRSLVWI